MQRRTRFTGKAMTALALVSVAALGLSACGGSTDSGTGGSGDDIAVTLITKTNTNPFFIAMQEGAKKEG